MRGASSLAVIVDRIKLDGDVRARLTDRSRPRSGR